MIYLALGRRKLGKTTLVTSMARRCDCRLILDPRGLIHTSDALRVTNALSVSTAGEMMLTGRTSEVIVTPDSDVFNVFDSCARFVKQWSQVEYKRRLMFVVDEARFFQLLDSDAFEYLLRAAPPELIHVAITAHRPSDIPTDIRAISDHWLLFRCTQEHDLKVIEERCSTPVRRAVAQLEPHQFVHWDDSIGVMTAHRKPEAWFIQLAEPSAARRLEPVQVLPDDGIISLEELQTPDPQEKLTF